MNIWKFKIIETEGLCLEKSILGTKIERLFKCIELATTLIFTVGADS